MWLILIPSKFGELNINIMFFVLAFVLLAMQLNTSVSFNL